MKLVFGIIRGIIMVFLGLLLVLSFPLLLAVTLLYVAIFDKSEGNGALGCVSCDRRSEV